MIIKPAGSHGTARARDIEALFESFIDLINFAHAVRREGILSAKYRRHNEVS